MNQTINVAYVADLAHIALTPDEVVLLQGQLEGLLQYVGKIGEVDVSGVEPMVYGLAEAASAFREDTVEPSGLREQMLAMAPARHGNEFKLPKIVEDA
ncbi:MAG: Asp-tRNA(Asn)/Glu-tRNA(Gln) amidotransferase subunit GatC [Kiritimatiellaeota bacterium]|nr:Asp-tRNA(Asn)/Glu-tRNA(Gln) amidotransferase subunit GatC [Kiritimatiellota bacterium]